MTNTATIEHPIQLTEEAVIEQDFIEANVREQRLESGPSDPGRILRYRHDWGANKGLNVLRLNWRDIRPDTVMAVSAGEGIVPGDNVAGKFVGNAHFTVLNVAPRMDGVDIRVNVEWPDPLTLQVDYVAALF